MTLTTKATPSRDEGAMIALAERVEAGSGPDRELDFAIGLASGAYRLAEPLTGDWDDGDTTRYVTYIHPQYGTRWHGAIGACIPNLTSSLDAVVALVERVLPGCRVLLTLGTGKRSQPEAWVYPTQDGPVNLDARAASPARALLAATLRALASQEPTP